jgi:polyphenol oxidase
VISRRAERCEYLQFRLLAEIPDLTHAVFTRHGGFSSAPYAGLNLSAVTGDDLATVARNREVVVGALELPLVGAHTVHGSAVVRVERAEGGQGGDAEEWLEPLRAGLRRTPADAMIAHQSGFALCWAYGDCAPVLLYDPRQPAWISA